MALASTRVLLPAAGASDRAASSQPSRAAASEPQRLETRRVRGEGLEATVPKPECAVQVERAQPSLHADGHGGEGERRWGGACAERVQELHTHTYLHADGHGGEGLIAQQAVTKGDVAQARAALHALDACNYSEISV